MKPEKIILFSSIPKLQQLTYFLALIDFTEDQKAFSQHNWQKIKSRCLIENETDIIAAPVERKLSYMHLIASKYQKVSELEKLMADNKITLLGPYSLQNDTYLKALFYTLTVKISSEWVQIENCFVKTCFLNTRNAIEGVQLQFTLTDGWLTVFVKTLKMKLPLTNLIDLRVDVQTVYNNGFAVVNQKVYVLPSLRLGTALNVHLNIPPDSPFKNYEDMRSHWRNLYGYILPQTSERMLYVEVTFDRSSMSYLYPIICVCSYKPIQFQCGNDLGIIAEFLDTWKRNVASICRHPVQVRIDPNGTFPPDPKFHLASEIPEDLENSYFSPLLPSVTPASPLVTEKREPFKCISLVNPFKKVFCNSFRSPTLKKPMNTTLQEESKQKATGVKKRNSLKLLDESSRELEESVRSKDLKKFKLCLLKKFCREHKIPVKAKDRKDCVLKKIYNFFAVSSLNH